MKTPLYCLGLVFLFTAEVVTRAQGILTYQLLPDSTITPRDAGGAEGSSESLAGVFSWNGVFASQIVDSMEFSVTSLAFHSQSYVLELASSAQPDNTTQIGPNGATALNAYVDWRGSGQNPYFLGGFGQGTYVGPASAPTQLIMTEGLGPSGGGPWSATLFIHAQLVPEQPSWIVTALGLGGLALMRKWRE